MKRLFHLLSLGSMAFYWLACNDDGPSSDLCETNAPFINTIEVSNTGCNESTGTLLIQAGGGNGALSYSLNGSDFQPENSFSQLAAGSYTVSVRDEQNCQVSQDTVVEAESGLGLSITSVDGSGCGTAEGVVRLEAHGGQGAYTYSLDGTNFQEEDEFSDLAAGVHTFYVKDATGCELSEDFEVKTGISFNSAVRTIIDGNCAVSGCHVAGTGRANFTQFSAIQENAPTIQNYIQNGVMPPEGSGQTLTDSEIEAIVCWVEDGAPQN